MYHDDDAAADDDDADAGGADAGGCFNRRFLIATGHASQCDPHQDSAAFEGVPMQARAMKNHPRSVSAVRMASCQSHPTSHISHPHPERFCFAIVSPGFWAVRGISLIQRRNGFIEHTHTVI